MRSPPQYAGAEARQRRHSERSTTHIRLAVGTSRGKVRAMAYSKGVRAEWCRVEVEDDRDTLHETDCTNAAINLATLSPRHERRICEIRTLSELVRSIKIAALARGILPYTACLRYPIGCCFSESATLASKTQRRQVCQASNESATCYLHETGKATKDELAWLDLCRCHCR